MRRAFYSAVVVLVLSAGCVRPTPETPQPAPPPPAPAPVEQTSAPKAPAPEEAPAPKTKSEAAPPVTEAPTPPATEAPTPLTTTKPTAEAPAPKAPGAAAAPVTKAPAPATQKPAAKAPVSKPAALAAAPSKPAAGKPLDLDALIARLKETKAIGVFTKLSLKNKVDDLLDEFREHHSGKPEPTVADLRQSYDLLMMKVLSLLQDDDQQLASRDRVVAGNDLGHARRPEEIRGPSGLNEGD